MCPAQPLRGIVLLVVWGWCPRTGVIGVNVNPVLAEAEDTEVDNDWVSVNGGGTCRLTVGQRAAIVTVCHELMAGW